MKCSCSLLPLESIFWKVNRITSLSSLVFGVFAVTSILLAMESEYTFCAIPLVIMRSSLCFSSANEINVRTAFLPYLQTQSNLDMERSFGNVKIQNIEQFDGFEYLWLNLGGDFHSSVWSYNAVSINFGLHCNSFSLFLNGAGRMEMWIASLAPLASFCMIDEIKRRMWK